MPSLSIQNCAGSVAITPHENRNVQLACLITCYNYQEYIGRAIRSVMQQAEGRCEIIVVDNASTDDSWSIIESFGLKKTYRLDKNYGQLGACQHGFRQTDAPFVLVLDSDDELAPGALSKIFAVLDHGVSKVQFPLTPVDGDGRIIGPPFPRLRDSRERFSFIRTIEKEGYYTTPPTSGNVLSRELCELFMDVDYEASGDGISLLAAPFFGDVVSFSTPLGFYRVHGRNISSVGSRPTVEKLDEVVARFRDRLLHLSRVVDSRHQSLKIAPESALSYQLTHKFLRKHITGEQPGFGLLISILYRLLLSERSARKKLGEMIYYVMMWALPRSRSAALLDYRYRLSPRSASGAIKSVIYGTSAI